MSHHALSLPLLLLAACAPVRQNGAVPAAGPAASAPLPAAPPTLTPAGPANRWNDLRRRGTEFVASGNEPFWSLELTSQGQVRFRTVAAGDSLLLPLPAPSQAQDAPVLRYRALTAAGELTVTIAQRPCPNSMSGEVLPYTVAVRAQTSAQATARDFAGCGRYLGDSRLHDLWALESIDGQAVDRTQFGQQKPYLELNLTTGQVLGFGGCNGLGGSLTPERAGLRFGNLNGTMMACPALPFEQKFRGALSGQSFTYRIENLRLTLKNRVNTLVFRRFD